MAKLYANAQDFESDYESHRVSLNHPQYGWKSDKDNYGWYINNINVFKKPRQIDRRPGIKFSRGIHTIYWKTKYVRSCVASGQNKLNSKQVQKKRKYMSQ